MPLSAISVAVCDAGPLIALARLDRLSLLAGLFSRIPVPDAGLEECTARPELVDAERIRRACDDGLLTVCAAEPIGAANLGRGERSAIGKALELDAALLADDLAARHHAATLGLVTIGTLGVLVQARRKALLLHVRPIVEELRANGYRLSDETVQAALRVAGESDR